MQNDSFMLRYHSSPNGYTIAPLYIHKVNLLMPRNSDDGERFNFIDSHSLTSVAEPIYLTKNGYGDMVVMSIEAFEKINLDNEIYIKLKEAEIEAKSTDVRYSHNEVLDELRTKLGTENA